MELLIVALVVGFYMAWNIGANDVANAMGTSVGSGALNFRRAVLLAGIFEFAGAVLVGGHVSDTVRKDIVDPLQFADDPNLLIYGMLSALVAAALWLHLASYFGQPVSTTHSIVGGVFGFGLIANGAVEWGTMGKIVASWLISPFFSGLLAFLLFRLISKRVMAADNPIAATRAYAPFFVFLVAVILVLSFIFKGLKNLHLDISYATALGMAAGIGAIVAFLANVLVFKRMTIPAVRSTAEEYAQVERIFIGLQITTACYVAFAHGANDVANAVGPLAAIYSVHSTGEVAMKVGVPLWTLVLGGVGIVTGLAMYGRKVMETVGTKITEMTPSRGFAAEFAAATTVLTCSKLGIPVSTTHALVGAVMGVGLARGIAGVNAKVARSIFSSWVATVPITAGMTAIFYLLIKWTMV